MKIYLLKEVRSGGGSLSQMTPGMLEESGRHVFGASQSLTMNSTTQISSYIVHNISDLDLEISYSGTSHKISNGARHFLVENYLQDKSLVLDRNAISLEIKIKNPQDGKYHVVANINLDNIYQQKLFPISFVKGNSERPQPALLLRVQKDGYYTLVTFMTPLAIENNLPYPVKVIFLSLLINIDI